MNILSSFYGKHEPMHISPLTFGRLLTIVGSISWVTCRFKCRSSNCRWFTFTHEHYQGGRHTFPMEVAGIKEKVSFDGYSDVEAGIVNWPMSVLSFKK